MFKSRWLICLFMVAAGLEGCQWNSELYQAYVNEKDGNIESCYGACHVSLNQEECQTHQGQWIAEKCEVLSHDNVENIINSDTVKDLASCRTAGGVWYDAYCQIDLNHKDKCTTAGGEWAEYHMLDLGDGLYIRKIIHEDKSEQFICGSYALVITNHQNASSCKEEDIDKFVQSQKYQLCPVGTTCQLAYQQKVEDDKQGDENTEKDDNLIAVCSSCPQNSIMCRNAQGEFACTYIESDAENCGECGNTCEDGYSCTEGECILTQVKVCEADYISCGTTKDGNPICYNPASDEYCGAYCEEDTIKSKKCINNYVCKKNNKNDSLTQYGCFCESGIVIEKEIEGKITNYCVDPSSDEHCGATLENKLGKTCHLGTQCADVDGVFRCTCALTWMLSCYYDDGINVDCIDPNYNMEYCGAEACTEDERNNHSCSSSEVCYDGKCICRDNYVKCDNECINPMNHTIHCGAKGECSSVEKDENYIGTVCGDYQVCRSGECECMTGYVECNDKCIHPSEVQNCGVKKTDNGECVFDDCSEKGAICILKSENEGYECVCPSGQVMCGDRCIDPKSNDDYCGAKDCSVGQTGEKCPSERPICFNGECILTCPDGQEQCGSTCVLTASDINNCGECNKHCEFKNGLAYCSSGKCELAGCISGFADCDDDEENEENNGCETNIKTDHNNCGVCGHKCDFLNADSECVDGKCQITECKPGFKDCDKNLQNGCEQDLQTALNACGDCDKICSHDNAVSICNNGVCEMNANACYNGYDNCDLKPENGCEVHLMSDPNNCGACSTQCVYENAKPNCESGICLLGECYSGYDNCDNMTENGCEIDLMVDSNNCGGCEIKCSSQYICDNKDKCLSCESGICCIKGELSGDDNNGSDSVKCCEGYELWKYKSDFWSGCWDSKHYGCFKPEEAEGLSNCWSKVSQ